MLRARTNAYRCAHFTRPLLSCVSARAQCLLLALCLWPHLPADLLAASPLPKGAPPPPASFLRHPEAVPRDRVAGAASGLFSRAYLQQVRACMCACTCLACLHGAARDRLSKAAISAGLACSRCVRACACACACAWPASMARRAASAAKGHVLCPELLRRLRPELLVPRAPSATACRPELLLRLRAAWSSYGACVCVPPGAARPTGHHLRQPQATQPVEPPATLPAARLQAAEGACASQLLGAWPGMRWGEEGCACAREAAAVHKACAVCGMRWFSFSMCTRMWGVVRACVCVHMCVSVRMRVHASVCAYVCMRAYVCVCICVHACVRMCM